ncbi:MAG: hypothetical protein M0010_04630 [Actinomycetota bacterium]|nr:hypothetical protein [Actinomycetota bacterium]
MRSNSNEVAMTSSAATAPDSPLQGARRLVRRLVGGQLSGRHRACEHPRCLASLAAA